MRTTLTIDDDVLEQARTLAAKLGRPFKTIVNEALRAGLAEVARPAVHQPYETQAHAMGLRQGYDLDNVQELVAQIEGDDTR